MSDSDNNMHRAPYSTVLYLRNQASDETFVDSFGKPSTRRSIFLDCMLLHATRSGVNQLKGVSELTQSDNNVYRWVVGTYDTTSRVVLLGYVQNQ